MREKKRPKSESKKGPQEDSVGFLELLANFRDGGAGEHTLSEGVQIQRVRGNSGVESCKQHAEKSAEGEMRRREDEQQTDLEQLARVSEERRKGKKRGGVVVCSGGEGFGREES
jgi:hypothetical protein